jgi:hypothetical protein
MRARNYEGIMGSALLVDGELMFSSSADGTNEATYVGLAAGALVQCGSLYNQGTSWSGPTSGYAVLSTGYISYLNWEQDAPATGGYFANNIYVQADTWTNQPGGNGMGGETAEAKFANVKNATGNGGVTVVDKGSYEVIPADNPFVKGETGCTPGFKIDIPTPPTPPVPDADLRIICEDLSATTASDFDFNDIVIDVTYGSPAVLTLQAAGGTLPLRINGDNNLEVHKLFGVWEGDEDIEANTQKQKMVNTGAGPSCSAVVIDSSKGFNMSINSAEDAKNLKIEVYKNGSWQELTAEKGEPACKLAVDPTFTWMSERKSIKDEYELFVTWATDNSFKSKWW